MRRSVSILVSNQSVDGDRQRTEKHLVPMTDVIINFRDRWGVLMRVRSLIAAFTSPANTTQPHVDKLVKKDILDERDYDASRLKPFKLTMIRGQLKRNPNHGWAYGSLNMLEKMARAMGSLVRGPNPPRFRFY
jgi:ATP-dependent DNA helicase MPH1